MIEEHKWIYILRQSEDEEETIDLFDNAGSIIIRRFIFKGNDMLSEEIHINGGVLRDTIHKYFETKRQEIKQ